MSSTIDILLPSEGITRLDNQNCAGETKTISAFIGMFMVVVVVTTYWSSFICEA